MRPLAKSLRAFCQRRCMTPLTTALVCALPLSGAAGQSWYTAANVSMPAQAMDSPAATLHEMPDLAPDDVERRLLLLHSALRITAPQEALWLTLAQAIRDNAASLALLSHNKTIMAAGNVIPLSDLQILKRSMHDHGMYFSRLIGALNSLYAHCPAQQQRLAAEAFANFGTILIAAHN